MYSLHLTGHPGFLLLFPAGLYLLWRQYLRRGPSPSPGSFQARVLFGLQTMALGFLVLSLAAPEFRRRREEFHKPIFLVLRDVSGSFANGEYLRLGSRLSEFQSALVKYWRPRGYQFRYAEFDSAVRIRGVDSAAGKEPVSGGLTSMVAAADFADTAELPNLQGIVLLSDGRGTLDSGRAARDWKVPVYPIVISSDSLEEVQIDRVVVKPVPTKAGAGLEAEASPLTYTVSVAWEGLGSRPSAPLFKLIIDGKVGLSRSLPLGAGRVTCEFPWAPARSIRPGAQKIFAVLEPARTEANFDVYNDTAPIIWSGELAEKTLLFYGPFHSLEERAMLDMVTATGKVRVGFFGEKSLGLLGRSAENPLTGEDQVWLEQSTLANPSLLAALSATAARVVVYCRGGDDRVSVSTSAARTGSGPAGAVNLPSGFQKFDPEAEIRPERAVAGDFPYVLTRLKSIFPGALTAPTNGVKPLVRLAQAGVAGILVGRLTLPFDKHALYFTLPPLWPTWFDPQSDFQLHIRQLAYIQAIPGLVAAAEDVLRASFPKLVYADIPFHVQFRLPDSLRHGPGEFVLKALAAGFAREWGEESQGNLRVTEAPGTPDAGGEIDAVKLSLPQGRYRLELSLRGKVFWSDSLESVRREALELRRIGYDRSGLAAAAIRSGGRLIEIPEPRKMDSAWVTSLLPSRDAAETRSEKILTTRLYDTVPLFLVIVALLSFAWLLRKKWNLD